MNGPALAAHAVAALAAATTDLAGRHALAITDLQAVYAHAGNGRLAHLLARRLALEPGRVRSETARTGNLGTVSLLAAWDGHTDGGPVVWAAVGAGLAWGAALLDAGPPNGCVTGSWRPPPPQRR